MDMLTTLNEQGTTIMMVTHSAGNASKAHRTIQMLDGQIVSSSPNAEVSA